MKIDKDDEHLIEGKILKTNRDGYFYFKENRNNVYIHRLVTKAKKGQIVDHINGDVTDNRKCNLRFVTVSQNAMNKRGNKGSSSQYKGVFLDKKYYKDKEYIYWGAKVKKDGVVVVKKNFKDEKEAARWYDEQALEIFGEYARLNFPRNTNIR